MRLQCPRATGRHDRAARARRGAGGGLRPGDHPPSRSTKTPPGGTGDIAAFTTNLRNITNRFRGLEVAVDERFNRPGDPPSFGSIKKVTYWRYAAERDRYVRYRTVVHHLSNPS